MKYQLITKDFLMNDLIEKHPETAEILMAYGLNCVNCHFSDQDTLEAGVKIHGLGDEDIRMILKDINTTLNENASKT